MQIRHTLQAKGLHAFMEMLNEWRKVHHVDKNGDIIFQNSRLFTNIRLTSEGIHKISTHLEGYERLPETVQTPDEVWGVWEKVDEQRTVIRSYITFGSPCYVVRTKNGVILDAFSTMGRNCDKYRRGVLL